MEKRIARGLLVVGLLAFMAGAALGAVADRAGLVARAFGAPGPGIQNICPGEFDIRDEERLDAAWAFVEERYGVTLSYLPYLMQLSAVTGIPMELLLQAGEGRRPAVLYNFVPLGGCLAFDFNIVESEEEGNRPEGILVLVRPAGDGFEVIHEQRYPIR